MTEHEAWTEHRAGRRSTKLDCWNSQSNVRFEGRRDRDKRDGINQTANGDTKDSRYGLYAM